MTSKALDMRFHAVYLLRSGDPKFNDGWYIGYTTNPLRRLRQHNGELTNGAVRTKRRGRPWKLVCFVDGFAEDQMALKFEYCWTYPQRSKIMRSEVFRLGGSNLKKFSEKVGILHLLLETPLFKPLALTLNILDQEVFESPLPRIHAKGIAPLQNTSTLKIEYVTPDEVAAKIPKNGFGGTVEDEEIAEAAAKECLRGELGLIMCSLCGVPVLYQRCLECPGKCSTNNTTTTHEDAENSCCGVDDDDDGCCPFRAHITCLALWFFAHDPKHPLSIENENRNGALSGYIDTTVPLVPTNSVPCPVCNAELQWSVLTRAMKRRLQVLEAHRAALAQSNVSAVVNDKNFVEEKKRYMEEVGLVAKKKRKEPVNNANSGVVKAPKRPLPSIADIVGSTSSLPGIDHSNQQQQLISPLMSQPLGENQPVSHIVEREEEDERSSNFATHSGGSGGGGGVSGVATGGVSQILEDYYAQQDAVSTHSGKVRARSKSDSDDDWLGW